MIWGLIHVPPFAITLKAAMYWTWLTATPCPKASSDKSNLLIWSGLLKVPADSPGKSIPVFWPNPIFFAVATSLSLPSLFPNSAKPTLQEFFIISTKLSLPCPFKFQQWIVLPSIVMLPSHIYVSFNPILFSKALAAVTTLNIDPGSKLSWIEGFFQSISAFLEFLAILDALLRSTLGLFAIANISPFWGFITIILTAFALLSSKAFWAACSAYCWITESIVKITFLPSTGRVYFWDS